MTAAPTDLPPGRVLLVTGASSGIGRATVVELARRARSATTIVLVARRGDELEATAALARAASPADHVTYRCIVADLGDPDAVAELGASVAREFGRIDALVNNAGVGSVLPFADPGFLDDADRMLALNLRAPIALVHDLLPQLTQAGGSIVNVSSVAGLVGTPHSAVYSATKWALTGFTEAMRAQLRPQGVRVIGIHPGPVPTPGWPHEHLASRPIAGRLLASRVDRVAAAVARAAEGRGPDTVVLPATYRFIPVLRGIAPPAVRALLDLAVRRGVHARVTGRPEGVHTP